MKKRAIDSVTSRRLQLFAAGAAALFAVSAVAVPALAEDKPASPAAAKKDAPKPQAAEDKHAGTGKPSPDSKKSAAESKPAEKQAPPVTTGALPNAAPPAPPAATFGDWVLVCSPVDAKRCALRQRLADQKGRQIIAFKAAKSAAGSYLEVSAPLGLSIPYGVALVLPDKTEFRMELADCGLTGCRAVAPLDEKTLAKLKTAERLGVRFQDSKSGKVLTVNGSLKGFADGIAKVLGAG